MLLACEIENTETLKKIQNEILRNFYQQTLIDEDGLELEVETNETEAGKVIEFVKIHAPFEVLALHAERMGLKLPLKAAEKLSLGMKSWKGVAFVIRLV